MGCQCANSTEEQKIELLKKGSEMRDNQEQEQDQENRDSNIFGLKNQEDDSQNNNNNSGNMNGNNYDENIKNNDTNSKYSDYSEAIIKLINQIRQDPISFADTIEESIENIIDDVEKNKIIYKKKVKVALTRGEPAFREAAEKLRLMSPLSPLIFKPEICIPLPDDEEEIKDSSYLKEQVKIIRENYNIDVFFKDLIKIPEVSALLMIVDDSGKNPGRKRQAVLNPNFKYIGVTSKFIGKTFVAYFSFSK